MESFIIGALITIGVIVLISIRQIAEYERGVRFLFGKYNKTLNPGWRLVFPIIHSMRKIDTRTKTVDVPEQDIISKDNISLRVSAVLYFKIRDPKKAVCDVEDYMKATSQLALTTMKTIAGKVTLDNLLSERDALADNIKATVATETGPWGVMVENVEFKEIRLPDDLQRMIAREAEAEREKKAVITKASGEIEAAENLAKAAKILSEAPGALHLRTLSTLSDISTDKGTKLVFAIPVEVLEALGRVGGKI
jgi:regulator of protease activity HflC (stomatin/prohibitin superfamily)